MFAICRMTLCLRRHIGVLAVVIIPSGFVPLRNISIISVCYKCCGVKDVEKRCILFLGMSDYKRERENYCNITMYDDTFQLVLHSIVGIVTSVAISTLKNGVIVLRILSSPLLQLHESIR